MAARYATASGNWTGAIWAATPGGVAGSAATPTAADACTIEKNRAVTLDATTCACLSLTFNIGTTAGDSGGSLIASTSANSKLTVEGSIVPVESSGGSPAGQYSSYINLDMAAAAGFTCEIVLNNANSGGAGAGITTKGNFNFKGAPKTRCTTLVSAVSAGASAATVTDATGWRPGDAICFATTSAYNNPPKTDLLVLDAAYTPGSTSLVFSATPDTTINPGATATFANAHAVDCPVGNLRSNLIFRPGTAGGIGYVMMNSAQMSIDGYVTDVEFRGALGTGTVFVFGFASTHTNFKSVSNNAFYDYRSAAVVFTGTGNPAVVKDNNIFYTTANAVAASGADNSGAAANGPDRYWTVFRNTASSAAITVGYQGQDQIGHKISGHTMNTSGGGAIHNAAAPGTLIKDCAIWSSNVAISSRSSQRLENVQFGSQVFAGCDNTNNFAIGACQIEAVNCNFPSSLGITGMSANLPLSYLTIVNKNDDTALQEVYGSHSNTVPMIQRDTSGYTTDTGPHSTSALLMTASATSAITKSFQVLAKAGQTVLLLVRVQRNAAYKTSTYTEPSVTVYATDGTTVLATATMAGATAANVWETLSLSATNSGSSDGMLTVVFSAQSATSGGKAWFSGCPISPFVSRCRHYGYLFNETSPTRDRDTASGLWLGSPVSEDVAAAYAGMTVTWGTSSSTVALSASQTFQKLYDYCQAQACQNVGSAVPLTGAGVAGSPSLFAQGNLTTTGYTLNGPGSISLDTNTLTATGYTYTGGVFSQSSATPSFSGGTLTITTPGTYSYGFGGSMRLSLTTTGGYHIDAGTFDGSTITVDNPNNVPITVYAPAGGIVVAGTNPGNTTISAPTVNQSVTISGAVAGSRIQIYDTTSSTELYNGTPTFPYTWTDASPAAASRAIRLRVTSASGTTAYAMIEASIGTCGITAGTESVSYLVNQTADTTYNTNAIDGSTVSNISIDDSTNLVKINLSATGTFSNKSIYAYQVYWLNTEAGIRDDFAFITAPDTANYIYENFQWKNTGTGTLTIVDGYPRDVTTGLSVTLIDTSGGNICVAPDHVIPYSVGSGLTAGQAAQLSTIATDAVGTRILENGYSVDQVQKLTAAVLLGKVSGGGTATETFKGIDGTTDRVVADVDSSGNRTTITLNSA